MGRTGLSVPEDRLDQPTVYGARAKLGVIVPPTNTANEAEWRNSCPEGVTVHTTRMALHTDTESEGGMRALYDDIRRASSDLAQAGVDVIAYGCTAGSMVDPYTALPDFMRQETGCPAVTTAQAIVEALKTLGARKIVIATPYGPTLNAHEVKFLRNNGFEILAERGLGYGEGGPAEYRNIARVTPEEVVALVRETNREDADAIVISCTDLATFPVIERIETEHGKAVVTSNQATLWHALRQAGIADRIGGLGRLPAEH